MFLFLSLFLNYELLAKSDFSSIFIKSCYDGDTCTATDGEKIRLACIDTPELKGKNSDPKKAIEAKDFLNNLVVDKEILINRITKDRYDRTVAELFKDGVNIQELIVNEGYGKVYKKYSYQCEWSK